MKSQRRSFYFPMVLAALVAGIPYSVALQAAEPTAKHARAAESQKTFATPEEAAQALLAAMRTDDLRAIHTVLGPGSGRLIYSGDKVADAQARNDFVAAYEKANKFDREGDTKATLVVGENNYPFPFPLVKGAAGWRFDAKRGADEIVNRRIGANELAAIQVCLAYVDAQREFVLKDRDSNGALEYAQKLVSTPGKHDGLYWAAKEGESPSPLGPLGLKARREGYSKDAGAYHGYRYKILTGQGKDAHGGAYDYVVKGKMIGGFGLVAWPARWGASGVMTFVCNHDGVVYETNLGPDTGTIAAAMTRFNPDSTWKKSEN